LHLLDVLPISPLNYVVFLVFGCRRSVSVVSVFQGGRARFLLGCLGRKYSAKLSRVSSCIRDVCWFSVLASAGCGSWRCRLAAITSVRNHNAPVPSDSA